MRQRITLTESHLHRIIKESVKQILTELDWGRPKVIVYFNDYLSYGDFSDFLYSLDRLSPYKAYLRINSMLGFNKREDMMPNYTKEFGDEFYELENNREMIVNRRKRWFAIYKNPGNSAIGNSSKNNRKSNSWFSRTVKFPKLSKMDCLGLYYN